jgi:hypothetical protein
MKNVKEILVTLGYVEAGVLLDDKVLNTIERELVRKGLRKDSYLEGDYKYIGDFYKYLYIADNDFNCIQGQSFNSDNADDYTSKFWKIYSPMDLELEELLDLEIN